MNINVISSCISNEGIVSFAGCSKLFNYKLGSNLVLSFNSGGGLKKNSLLSLSLQNIYEYLFVNNRPLGYGIIIVLLLVIVWAIRSRTSKKDSIIQEDTNSNKNLINKASEVREGMNVSGVSQVSSNNDLTSDLLNDKELVAIITAALMAYMGEDEVSDGLVIRSIRKVNRRKQTNELNIY